MTGSAGIKSQLVSLVYANIDEFPLEDLDRLFAVREDMNVLDKKEIVKELYLFLRKMRRATSDLFVGLDTLASGTVAVAQRRMVIAAANVSAYDATTDLLTITSATDYEFDFTDTRRITRMVLAPVQGREPHELIFDKIVKLGLNDGYPQSVYAQAPTKLQLTYWDGSAWAAVDWQVGWTIDVWQIIIPELPVLAIL